METVYAETYSSLLATGYDSPLIVFTRGRASQIFVFPKLGFYLDAASNESESVL
jgi:hypothetical protein